MIVVVDSGSTKADWKMIKNGDIQSITTMGFNPVFHSEDKIYKELRLAFGPEHAMDKAANVYYYGAGCWDHNLKQVVHNALSRIFTNAEIEVEHDLLGAARATCGTKPGISCIIGTGSNSCLYDGREVIDNVTNLGFLLGDEGSGTHLGKKLIRAYFYREMPSEIREKMELRFPNAQRAILENVYRQESPNVYLASFTRFMHANKSHPFVQRLLHDSFAEFIDRHARKYQNHLTVPIHFIGSVAYYFQDIIKVVLEERNMQPGTFIQKPIGRMVSFHTAN